MAPSVRRWPRSVPRRCLLDLASESQQDRYLAGVAKGSVLTFALNEPGAALPDRPSTALCGGRLNGTKVAVGYAGQADWIVVTTDSGVVVVAAEADGLTVTKTPTSNGSDEYVVSFVDVEVADADVLGGATAHRLNQLVLAVDRRVRRRSGRRGAAADRRLRRHPGTVRQAAVDVPDRGCAALRGLHRLPHHLFGRHSVGLAADRGA